LQAVEAIATCLGQQDLAAGAGGFLPFFGAAFLLLLGLGRFAPVFRTQFLATSDEAPAPTTLAARIFPTVANLVAVLYIPAALLLGAGLAGEVILAEPGPLVCWLELAGVGFGLLSIILLLTINMLVRDPYVGGGLARPAYDRPVLCTNAALRRRGTNRFEVVLVTFVVLGLGGWQLGCPYLQTYAPTATSDCPPTEEPASSPLAWGQFPPSWDFARLPNRSGEPPELRLGREEPSDTWRNLAALTFPPSPAVPESQVVPNLIRPILRPNELYPDAPSVPPPDMFGTVVHPTSMAPTVWQARVHLGYRTFGSCLDEGAECGRYAPQWASFVARHRGNEGVALYDAVNVFVNHAVQFQADTTLEEVLDDWITPETLMQTGEGDCEDFALAKFWLLEYLGVDKDDLYIVVVRDLVVRLPHAYLAVRDGDNVWLLDSRTDGLLTPDELEGIVPVITIGDTAAYLHGRPADPETPMSFLWEWLPFS